MKLDSKTYDVLKYIAQIVLPAIGTFYTAIAKIWGFPYAAEIVGTIVAIDALIGALLQFSSNRYYSSGANLDGTIKVDGETLVLELANEVVANKDTVTLSVDGKHVKK